MASSIPREVKKEKMDTWLPTVETVWKVALLSDTFVAPYTATPYGVYINYADILAFELATGSGYTRDNMVLGGRVGAYTGTSNENQFLDATDTQWTTATFTARYAIVYNDAAPKKIRFIYEFPVNKTVTGGTFTIQWSVNGLVKIS
jgi:hypothetical protein